MTGFEDVYEYLTENDEKVSDDIYYALEFLSTCLDPAVKVIKNGIFKAVENDDDEKEEKLKEYRDVVKEVKSQLERCLTLFAEKETIEEETDDIIEDEDDSSICTQKKDYSKCAVDQYKPHLLSEDYTKTKVCSFLFDGQKYEAKDAQEMLVKLCGMLYKENPGKFSTFENEKKFKGRKINYFGHTEIIRKNKIIPGTDMYVWINMSCNNIMKFIKKLLIECGHKPNEFYVYIRSDFNKFNEGE